MKRTDDEELVVGIFLHPDLHPPSGGGREEEWVESQQWAESQQGHGNRDSAPSIREASNQRLKLELQEAPPSPRLPANQTLPTARRRGGVTGLGRQPVPGASALWTGSAERGRLRHGRRAPGAGPEPGGVGFGSPGRSDEPPERVGRRLETLLL
ncbi:hypothetical protein EYF80_056312 [Liparis tanakae]|uniref:Uncharacterized protein n=1 Tax=Liparis tanakae TaxID=230148 RepID=A0A4Z2EXD7_9TELE|nr:hypothetical protein EYF80_056312 [Liparis tanakae]